MSVSEGRLDAAIQAVHNEEVVASLLLFHASLPLFHSPLLVFHSSLLLSHASAMRCPALTSSLLRRAQAEGGEVGTMEVGERVRVERARGADARC